jgi:hypothetical protein
LATLNYLGWSDAPHIQNFEILKPLEKTDEKKNEIIFDSNFGKDALFFRIETF